MPSPLATYDTPPHPELDIPPAAAKVCCRYHVPALVLPSDFFWLSWKGRVPCLTAHCSLRGLTSTFLAVYGDGLGQIATPPGKLPSRSPSSACLPLPCKCKTLVTGFPCESGAAAVLGCLSRRTLLRAPPNSLLAMLRPSRMAGLVSSHTLSSLMF